MTTSELRLEQVLDAATNVKIGEDFTLGELSSALKEEGCPYSQHVPAILRNTNIIIRNDDGSYSFTSEDWNEAEVGILLDELVKKLVPKSKKVTITSNKDESIQKAINLLKSKGYKILEPIVEYVEL